MGSFTHRIKAAFDGARDKSDGIRFSHIRPSRLIYFMAYALELVLYQVRGTSAFYPGEGIFGVSSWMVIYVVHMLASLVVMLLWSNKFKHLIRISVIVMIAGFIPWIFLPRGYLRLAAAAVAMAGLGGAVTSARCGYAFAANNAERLFGMSVMFVLATAVRVLGKFSVSGVIFTYVLPLLLLAALSVCLLKFREEDFEVKKQSTKSDEKGLYWALAFFIAYFAVNGYASSLLSAHFENEYAALIIGCAIPCLVFPLLFTRFRINTWHIWNIFFASSVAMGMCAAFAPQLGTRGPEILFCNLTYIGWPLCIYTLGCAQRRFASYALLKKSTVIFLVLSPLTTLSNDMAEALFPESLSIVTLLYVLVVAIAFLILSPFSYKHLFSAVWIKDIYRTDMKRLTDKVEEVDRFAGFGLTPRQREVAALLLAAKTRRQIAGELGLSESTVKMHSADLYRKLGINSRTELFRIFGVSELEESTTAE